MEINKKLSHWFAQDVGLFQLSGLYVGIVLSGCLFCCAAKSV